MAQRGLAESREKAKAVIMAGLVEVENVKVDKPGRLIPTSASVSVKKPFPLYVSRGGLKLEKALHHFSIDIAGQTVMDVGASTGGFTDCLLQHGAKAVISIDVGYGQLDWRLRQDPRVKVLEKKNVRYMKPEDIEGPVDGAVIDVSFISLRLVVPPVSSLLKDEAFIVALVKPQFEVGRGQVGKGGVVRDKKLHGEVIDTLETFFASNGWDVQGHTPSPILGPKGNQEFLMYVKR